MRLCPRSGANRTLKTIEKEQKKFDGDPKGGASSPKILREGCAQRPRAGDAPVRCSNGRLSRGLRCWVQRRQLNRAVSEA